ncbi:MAG TPA: hypothetical protein VNT79_08390 [Phycisphaerae bacterium]|nr:hypothetical protein [Phycisphaerae bacterium]
MKSSTAHVQQQLPITVHETRAARMQRLLSGDVGRVVKRASEYTFTHQRAAEATAKARQSQRVLPDGRPAGGASRYQSTFLHTPL